MANRKLYFIFMEYFRWANAAVSQGGAYERKCNLASEFSV